MSDISMGHGSGGTLMEELIARIRVAFSSTYLDRGLDSAILPRPEGELAFTTDSFVVRPLFFPGGDIGKLAVCGTVNDLSVVGATPLYLSSSLILEEGLSLETLDRAIASMAAAAREAGVEIVTGDTKVVEKGHGDGIYITTAGVGSLRPGVDLSGSRVERGDVLIVSGFLGDHAMTILGLRESLGFASALQSDCAPLNGMIGGLLDSGACPLFMRDITRGGLAAVLCELAALRGSRLEIEEELLPVSDEVKALGELLGIDPLTMANEGKVLAVVREDKAEVALEALRAHPYGAGARAIGTIVGVDREGVSMLTSSGGVRRVTRPYAEKLPRIC